MTWILGLPTSSSHALVGGLAGAAVATAGWGTLVASEYQKIFVFIVLSPIVGILLAFTFMTGVYWLFHRYRKVEKLNRGFRRGQLFSAAAFSLDCHAEREERDLLMATWLEEHGVELVVLAGYMHLLTKPFLDRFPGRIVNVHPSLLPEFPGAHAIEDALAAGVETTGVTIHLVDEGLDSGPILRQEALPVEPRETLEERIHVLEHRLLPAVVAGLLQAQEGTPARSRSAER